MQQSGVQEGDGDWNDVDGLVISELGFGATYRFRLRARTIAGASDWSLPSASVSCFPDPPSAPVEVRAIEIANEGVRVTWTPPQDNGGAALEEYRVFARGEDGDIFSRQRRWDSLFSNNIGCVRKLRACGQRDERGWDR